MKNYTIGRVYSCTSPNGCIVHTKWGYPVASVPAEGSSLFVAIDNELLVSDPDAIVKEVKNGKSLLLGELQLANYPGWLVILDSELTALLGETKFATSYLWYNKQLVVHTDRVDESMLEVVKAAAEAAVPAGVKVVQYNHNMEISWRDINKYAECETVEDLVAVDPEKHVQYTTSPTSNPNPYYTLDLTSDGNFVYPLPKLKRLNVGYGGSYFQKVTAEVFKISLPSLAGSASRLFQVCKAKAIECDLPLATSFGAGYCRSMLRFVGNTPNVSNWNQTFVDCNSLEELDCDFRKATTAENMLNNCQVNKKTVLNICVGEKSIPSYTSGTHKLTIGMHADLENDEEVLEALDEASAKGWTITPQWNGTSTASTFSLRPAPPRPVYAKLTAIEGQDGTEERVLDWGHDVLNPDGKEPEELGYTLFDSLEAAREYFNLPAEDLTSQE